MPQCPTCDKELDTERGLKVHHSRVHDESLIEDEDEGDVECPECGEMFADEGGMKTHYGHSHEGSLTEDPDYADVECPTCGKAEFETEMGMKTHHARVHDEVISLETNECAVCGDEFEAKPSAERKYCSHECRANGDHYKEGEEHGNYVEYDEYTCEWCGETFEEKPSNKNRFCSRECNAEWQSEAFSTEDWHLSGKRGEEHPKYEDHHTYYGTNWPEKQAETLERDGHQCVVCGRDYDDHKEEHGFGLDVHHIDPIQNYDPPRKANYLENLVTLCRQHHRMVEYGSLTLDKHIDWI